MYARLGLHWAASIPAFLALVCIPFPIVFWKYGPKIRARCKYAAESARIHEEMHATNSEEPDEAEAEERVADAERYQELVKSMSKQSRRSHRGGGRKGSAVVAETAAVAEEVGEGSKEKQKEDV